VPDHVTYTAVLPMRRTTVEFLAGLLAGVRIERRTREKRRALPAWDQAVMVCRWFIDGTRVAQLARDNAIGLSTAYRYLHEGIAALASRLPGLQGVLLAAKIAGHTHLNIDGTLIRTDRVAAPGPTPGVDLWWSGKHKAHGGNVQVITAPDGWPLWVSPVRPGRQHDTTAARSHEGLLDSLAAWATGGRKVLADLGYLGEAHRLTVPAKAPKGTELSIDAKSANLLHSCTRALGERGNALIKNYKAARRVTLSPEHVGPITAAILVLLHTEHDRTT
jgi:hypothetical protein